MKLSTFCILHVATVFLILLSHELSFAADIALAQAMAIDDNCIVVAWVYTGENSKRITFTAKKQSNTCTVEIAKEEFERNFGYCFLSGLKVESANSFFATFGGGPPGDRNIYWFEWGDANKVNPSFYCTLK